MAIFRTGPEAIYPTIDWVVTDPQLALANGEDYPRWMAAYRATQIRRYNPYARTPRPQSDRWEIDVDDDDYYPMVCLVVPSVSTPHSRPPFSAACH
jgi:hypothetical protein